MKLNVFKVIESESRIPCIDVFRSFAILAVVICHFGDFLPMGYLGVDLFFVISGFLVGGILIKKFKNKEPINFWQFFLRRGLKIWPSYYWLLLAGSAVVFVLYHEDHPDFMIQPGRDLLRYVFFYQNYTGAPYHPPFYLVWSLCVEEHFYILLPLFFIVLIALFGYNNKMLYIGIGGVILAGIVFKVLSIYFTNSKETYGGTHTRIDALAWGVLLALIVTDFREKLRKINWLPVLCLVAALLFAVNIYLFTREDYFYNKVVFHSIAPFCFFLMVGGAYFLKFSKLKPFRFIAYYSYNWYLWHHIFVWVIGDYFGYNLAGLAIYMTVSFSVAVFFTVLIEESFLKLRGMSPARVLTRIYLKNK